MEDEGSRNDFRGFQHPQRSAQIPALFRATMTSGNYDKEHQSNRIQNRLID